MNSPRPRAMSGAGGVLVPADEAEAAVAVASGACVLNFCASWCEPCVNLNAVFSELAEEHSVLRFVQACQELSPRPC